MQRFNFNGRWVGYEEYRKLMGLDGETTAEVAPIATEEETSTQDELEALPENVEVAPTLAEVKVEKVKRATKTTKKVKK